MSAGSIFVLVGFLAVFIEWLVERVCGGIPKLKGWPMVLIAAIMGIGLCMGFKVDLISLLQIDLEYPWWLGQAISGIIVGSGSNAIHKFFKPSKKE